MIDLMVVESILNLLTHYFVYIYPGLVSMFVYQFVKGHKLLENKMTFIKGVSLSYVYTVILGFFCNKEVDQLTWIHHIIILMVALILPILLNYIMKSKLFVDILRKLRIDTEPYDNVLDLIKGKEINREKGIVLKVFLDNQGIMYEGKLREHESDENKTQMVGLSGYRRYTKEGNKFVVKNDYSNDNSRWVVLKIKDVTRIEIKYEDEK